MASNTGEGIDQLGTDNVDGKADELRRRSKDSEREVISGGTQRQFEPYDPSQPPDIEAHWVRHGIPNDDQTKEPETKQTEFANPEELMQEFYKRLQDGLQSTRDQLRGAELVVEALKGQVNDYEQALHVNPEAKE